MDSFEEGSLSASDSNTLSKSTLIALVLSAVGFIIGLSGLIIGYKASADLDAFKADLSNKPDPSTELVKQLGELEEGLVKLGSETVKLGRQDRQLQENTKSAFDAVQESIRENRNGINAVTEQLGSLASSLEGRRINKVSSETSVVEPAEANTAANSESPGESGVHYIESGDTLSKIAKQYGVSLTELLNANPSVNPRALQIGQKIIIP